MLISFGLTSNQAFAGVFDFPFPTSCQDCDELEQLFLRECIGAGAQSEIVQCDQLEQILRTCAADFCRAIGGEFIPIDATAVLIAGIQTNALSVLSAFVVIGAIAFGTLYFSVKRKRN